MTAEEAAAGLRLLADWIEAHPDVPAHFSSEIAISLYPKNDDRETVTALARAMKPVEKQYGDELFTLNRRFGPITLRALFWRAKVCTRVVKGVRRVTETVPDPAWLESAPLIDVEREEEIIEWECEPILPVRS